MTAPPYVSFKTQPLNLCVPANISWLIGVCAILLNGWHADRTRERYLHVALPPILAVVAFIIALQLSSSDLATCKLACLSAFATYVLRLTLIPLLSSSAMCLMIGANYSGYVVALGWISNGMYGLSPSRFLFTFVLYTNGLQSYTSLTQTLMR